MKQNPTTLDLNSSRKIRRYILSNLSEMILIQASTFILSLRILLNYRDDIVIRTLFPFGLSLTQYIILLAGSMFLCLSYFIIIWSIRDAELRLIEESVSTTGKTREITDVRSVSDSFQSLFGYILGIPAILWLVNFVRVNNLRIITFNPMVNSAIIIIIILSFSIGGIIFASIFMINSTQYTGLVNSVRLWMLEATRDVPEFTKQFDQIPHQTQSVNQIETNQALDPQCPNCQILISTRYCTNCGYDTQLVQCPNCLASVDGSNSFCIKCGGRL